MCHQGTAECSAPSLLPNFTVILRRIFSMAALVTGALLASAQTAEAQSRFQATVFGQGGLMDPDHPVALGGGANLGVRMTKNVWLEGDASALIDGGVIDKMGADRMFRGSVMGVYAPTYGQKQDWGMQLGLGGTYAEGRDGSRKTSDEVQIGTMIGARFKVTDHLWLRTDAVVDISTSKQDANGFGRVGLQLRF